MTIPDADYIRKAERYGMPHPETVYCPVCGERCETIYKKRPWLVLGCDRCVRRIDAQDWAVDRVDRLP